MEPNGPGRQAIRETIERNREFERRRRKASEHDQERTGVPEGTA
jgi:hypothetical protein